MNYNFEVGQNFIAISKNYHSFANKERITLVRIYKCNTQGEFINSVGEYQTLDFEDVIPDEKYVPAYIVQMTNKLFNEIMNFHKECFINYCLEHRQFDELRKMI